MWMITSPRSVQLSSGSVLVISGRLKDRTGENHASASSPLKIRPKIQEQKSSCGTKGTYKIRVVDGRPFGLA
jgi:hypothetical protein